MFESTAEGQRDVGVARCPSCPPDGAACAVCASAVGVVAVAESVLERAIRRMLREADGATAADERMPSEEAPEPLPVEPAAVDPAPVDTASLDTASADARVDASVLDGPALDGLEDVGPGPTLARILAGVEVADLTDGALVEVVAAAERLRSWALAVQARAAGELADRAGGSSVAVDGAAAAIGARLCVTRRAADGLLGLAVGLSELPEAADALSDGRIDDRRTRVLVDGAVDLPREHRRAVVASLVGADGADGPASRLTGPRLRDRLRRAVVALDPEGGPRRRERARADRNVRFEPAGECMAYLTALLPADDAARARAGLDALAVTAHRTPGENRTLDQLRADTLVALLSGSRPVLGGLASTGAAGAAAGLGAATGSAAAVSAGTAGTAVLAGAGEGSSDGPGAPETPERPLAWTAPTVRTVVHVTVAASTLLGQDDHPGELTGFGPIPADLVRRLAVGGDATWQRIVTDPITGIATDVSRRTYRPGTIMGDLVRTRDATCTFPGCAVPAWRCDLDHVEAFDFGTAGPAEGATRVGPGQTRADNLHPVCRHHHNLKTHHGWSTSRDPATGTVTWVSPPGHEHRVGSHVTDPARVDGPPGSRRAPGMPSGAPPCAPSGTPHGVETRRPERPEPQRLTQAAMQRPPVGSSPVLPSDDEPPF